MNKTQLKKISRGMCRSCGVEPIYKANLCFEHYKKSRESAKRWYAERGREIHAQRQADKKGQVPYGWICPKCSAGNEVEDQVCWRCFENRAAI